MQVVQTKKYLVSVSEEQEKNINISIISQCKGGEWNQVQRWQESVGKSNTVKKISDFPVPSRDITNQTLPEGNSLIIPGQGKFGQ